MLASLVLVLAGDFLEDHPRERPRGSAPPAPIDRRTADDLAAMSDADLARLDPLVMDLIVARGIPGLENLDIDWYARIVDEWARRIDTANRAAEPTSHDDPTYRVSPEFWMAGGMAVMLAGPAFGIRYTKEHLDAGRPEQQFIHGILNHRTGTCATMPVLYMAIGHRLGWPIKAVVSGDHMWARWDGGGQRFNLEATSVRSDGSWGSFGSMTDEQYMADLGTPPEAIQSGSDFTSLTPRHTLGVFLQGRAAFWASRDAWDRAERDLRLALACFPQNEDIRRFYRLARTGGHTPLRVGPLRQYPRPRYVNAIVIDRLNREDKEAIERASASPTVHPLFPSNSEPR